MARREQHLSGQTPPPRGALDVLFDTSNAAPVIIRDMDGDSHGWDNTWGREQRFAPFFKRERGYQDDFRLEHLHDDETRYMAKLLLEPSRDPQQLMNRQAAIAALVSVPNLDELIALKNASYRTYSGAWDLLCYYGTVPEYWKAHEQRLISVYHEGITELPDYDESGFGADGTLNVQELMEEGLAKTEQGFVSFENLAAGLSRIPSDILAGVSQEVASTISETRGYLGREVLLNGPAERNYFDSDDYEWYHDEWTYLDRFTSNKLKPTLLRIAALVEFADLVRKDGWCAVTFDPAKSDSYIRGWNLERSKKSQVLNSSPEGLPIVIYSGANTSGKSFGMKMDFLLRLSAQAIGFAPAETGNLRLHEAFAFLDRASTQHELDLSAFMSEVENWKKVMPHLVANARLYVDEGFSTTSPDDQARLLLATAHYIHQQGGSAVLASHNENLIRRTGRGANVGVYHFRSDVQADGKLRRHFELTPGADDSKAIAVAKAQGFHPSVVEATERYLGGVHELPTPERTIHFPEINAYTPEQRAEMKLLAGSLEQLIPNAPSQPVLRLYTTDRDFTPGNFLRQQASQLGSDGSSKAAFARMILFAPTLSSEQTLERQQMFKELLADGKFELISDIAGRLRMADHSLAIIANSQAEGINKALYPLVLTSERKPGQKVELQSKDIEAAIAFLNLNAKLLGDRFNAVALLEKLRGLKEVTDAQGLILELEEAYRALPVVRFQDIPLDSIQEELDTLLAYRQGDKETTERISTTLQRRQQRHPDAMDDLAVILAVAIGGLPRALKDYPVYQEGITDLVARLRDADSVYLHQSANLAESLFASMVNQVMKNEPEDPEIDLTSDMGLFSYSMLGRRIDSSIHLTDTNPQKSPFGREMALIGAVCEGAAVIDKQKFAPVTFNSSGEVNLINGFNLFKAKGVQIPNSTVLGGENSKVHILTGPNGSGKTFYEKGAVAAVLTGLATGYAPAESATMSLFDSVIYLDRVTEKVGKDLSAFANELVFWDELVRTIGEKNAVFAAVDEAFSSTSPIYQSALTFAAVGDFRRHNQYLLLSTHNHEVVDALVVAGGDTIQPYHFSFDTEKGSIRYDYRIQRGHEGSHAVEVARTLGLNEEIVAIAETLF